jgi:pimeloyl-ACP methyl ester carboxylesterase
MERGQQVSRRVGWTSKLVGAAIVLIALVGVVLQLGCVPVRPLRVSMPAGGSDPECLGRADGATPGPTSARCRSLAIEKTADYTLNVVEFDDQGRLYSARNPHAGDAWKQERAFFDGLREAVSAQHAAGASVVVFVHGWKHSAAYDDPHLVEFRQILHQLAGVEERSCGRSVVGLYVGWRGKAGRAGDALENLTFWSRKFAAEQVATGQIHEVFGTLRAIQDTTPRRGQEGLIRRLDCRSRLKTTYVGHSFGGLVITMATAPALIRELAEAHERQLAPARMTDVSAAPPPDELAIVINPAVESARFSALYDMAQRERSATARAPRFVAITSQDDKATRIGFPLGRYLNSLTKAYPEAEDAARTAARLTLGHDANYLTHTLTSLEDTPDLPVPGAHQCEPLIQDVSSSAAPAVQQAARQAIPTAPQRALPRCFPVRTQADSAHQVRLLLRPFDTTRQGLESPANTEVWNITTQAPVVNDHNDFTNQRLLDFLGLLYLESLTDASVADKDLNRGGGARK